MYAYDFPSSFVSGHGLFSFQPVNFAKEAIMVINKSENWMLKCALLAFSLAVLANIYPS